MARSGLCAPLAAVVGRAVLPLAFHRERISAGIRNCRHCTTAQSGLARILAELFARPRGRTRSTFTLSAMFFVSMIVVRRCH